MKRVDENQFCYCELGAFFNVKTEINSMLNRLDTWKDIVKRAKRGNWSEVTVRQAVRANLGPPLTLTISLP